MNIISASQRYILNSAVFFLIIAPVAILSFWHLQNWRLPPADSINFLEAVFTAYRKVEVGGYIPGIWSAYLDLGWRPVIFPLFALPFMIISSGSFFGTIAFTNIFFYSLIAGYSYKLLRVYLDKLQSAVGASIISGNAMLFTIGTSFFSDIAYVAFGLAGLTHLILSGRHRNLKHSVCAGLFFGLALCLRPAESLGIVVILLGHSILCWKKNVVTLSEIYWSAYVILGGITITLALNLIRPGKKSLAHFALIIVLVTVIYLRKHWQYYRLKAFAMFWTSLSSVCLLWWLPNWNQLLIWVRANGPGGVVLQSLGIETLNFLELLRETSHSWQLFIFVGIIFSMLFLLGERKAALQNIGNFVLASGLCLYAYILFCYSIMAYDGGGFRRSLLAMIFCSLGFWIGPSRSSSSWFKGILSAIGLTLTLSQNQILLESLSIDYAPAEIVRTFSRHFVGDIKKPTPGPEMNSAMLVYLSGLGHLNLDRKAIFVPILDRDMIVDPFAVSFLSKISKPRFAIGTAFIGDDDNAEDKVRVKFDYVLLEDSGLIENAKSFSAKMAVGFLERARAGNVKDQVVHQFVLHEHKFYLVRLSRN